MTIVKHEEDDTTNDISGSQITHGNAQKHTYDDYWLRFQIIDIIYLTMIFLTIHHRRTVSEA